MLGFHSISSFPISTINVVTVPPPSPSGDSGDGFRQGGRYHDREEEERKERRKRLLQDSRFWEEFCKIMTPILNDQ